VLAPCPGRCQAACPTPFTVSENPVNLENPDLKSLAYRRPRTCRPPSLRYGKQLPQRPSKLQPVKKERKEKEREKKRRAAGAPKATNLSSSFLSTCQRRRLGGGQPQGLGHSRSCPLDVSPYVIRVLGRGRERLRLFALGAHRREGVTGEGMSACPFFLTFFFGLPVVNGLLQRLGRKPSKHPCCS